MSFPVDTSFKDNLALLSTDSPPLKVSELVQRLKSDVEEKHRFVRVVGEISSFKQWRSGHCYFDIKDEQAVLPAVMFRPHFARVPFQITDGLLVLFSGRISIYPANARLQMIVEAMEPLGQGALSLAFEQLKTKLLEEGLFDPRHKKPIKSFNECIGLITSSHGAVLKDMVRVLKTRMPKASILFSPVRVQGAGAKEEIKAAIELLDSLDVCDVIIVGRGGGSLEDLWAFNEELVARAIFNAKTPIISAVGHETDTTISDFVADLRAFTPTHAASIVVPHHEEFKAELFSMLTKLKLTHHHKIRDAFLKIATEKRRLKDPRVLLYRHWQKLDESAKELTARMNTLFQKQKNLFFENKERLKQNAPFRQLRLKKEALFLIRAGFLKHCPSHQIKKKSQELSSLKRQLDENFRHLLYKEQQRFKQMVMKLEALSPLKVLSRGFSLIQDEEQRVLSRKNQFHLNQAITIRIEDGLLKATITKKE